MNKKELYESIMRSVSVEVKKALSESFNFESAAAFDSILNALNDERLSNIVKDIDCNDIQTLVNELAKAAKMEIPEKAPLKISTIKSLANYILIKHFDDAAIKEIVNMGRAELNDLIDCVCNEMTGEGMPVENQVNDIENRAQYNQPMTHALPAPGITSECGCAKKQVVKECGCGNMTECGKKPAVKECGNPTNESLVARRRRFRF